MEKTETTEPLEAVAGEQAIELPRRNLMATVSVLGLPLVGVSDVGVNVDTTGPGWLISTG